MTKGPKMILGVTKGFPYKGFSDIKIQKMVKNYLINNQRAIAQEDSHQSSKPGFHTENYAS